MSLEAIQKVTEAERAAASAIAAGEAEAAEMVAAAEKDGETLLTRTYEECRREGRRMLRSAEERASAAALEITAKSEEDCLRLREMASERLAEAREMIVRKVVER